jgi:hypothetical protein
VIGPRPWLLTCAGAFIGTHTDDPAAEIETIRALRLSDQDTEAVLGGNIARLLGL